MGMHQYALEKLQHFPLKPAAVNTATFTGATTNIADLKDFEGDIQILLDAGPVTGGGTFAGAIQHSDTTTAGDFAAIVPAAAFTAVAGDASFQKLTLNSDNLKRYIRFVGTVAGTVSLSSSVVGYGLHKYG